MRHEESQTDLLERAGRGDQPAAGALLDRYRGRLERMVDLRLDRRLRGRVDAADVVQDAYLEAARRLPRYLEEPAMPFHLWLRFIVGQALLALQRQHLGAAARDARREIRVGGSWFVRSSSPTLAGILSASQTSPSRAAVRAEDRARIEQALDELEPIDREVLVLRHFEQLTAAETAQELGIQPAAASQRYVRALRRVKRVLDRD